MKRRAPAGFTLMELLVVIGLATLILAALHGFQRAQLFAMREQETRVEAQAATRATLDVMLREIRMAGYGGPCPNDLLPVLEAAPDRVRIQVDWNEDGAIEAGEDIAYAYDEASGEIRRTVAGDKGAAVVPVIAGVSSGEIFSFRDGAGAETASLADIRSVGVSVRVAHDSPRPDVPGEVRAGIEAEVALRNAASECDSGGPGDDDSSSGGSKSDDKSKLDDKSKDDKSKDDKSKDGKSKDDKSKDWK